MRLTAAHCLGQVKGAILALAGKPFEPPFNKPTKPIREIVATKELAGVNFTASEILDLCYLSCVAVMRTSFGEISGKLLVRPRDGLNTSASEAVILGSMRKRLTPPFSLPVSRPGKPRRPRRERLQCERQSPSVKGMMGEWRGARRRALPYENNAHSYRLTVAKLAQSKLTCRLSDWVGCRTG
jgi:hypothetical protein